MMIPSLPEEKKTFIRSRFGNKGQDWIDQLPAMLQNYADHWNFQFENESFEGGWPSNVVYPVVRGNERLVLKTGCPEPELFTELRVLQLWRGRGGCVQLIECDEEEGVMLMRRILPGDQYRHFYTGIERSQQAPELFQTVPTPLADDHNLAFPSYEDWIRRAFAAWDSSNDHFSSHIERVQSLFEQVVTEHTDTCLLHGDLHHENMLNDGVHWTTIDPKGVLGPAILEYGRYLHNFVQDEVAEGHALEEILVTRARSFETAHGVSADDVLKVGYIDLVLATTWTLNDGNPLSENNRQLIDQLGALA